MQQNYIFKYVHIIPKHIQSRLKHFWQSRGAPGYCKGSCEAEQELPLDCVHKHFECYLVWLKLNPTSWTKEISSSSVEVAGSSSAIDKVKHVWLQ